MHGVHRILLSAIGLVVFTAFDLRRALTSGRAQVWPAGFVTREHQPQRFWRHVYAGWALLILCAGVFVAILLRPAWFA
jgi:hypothetical protein